MMSHLEKAYQFDVHTRRDVDENFLLRALRSPQRKSPKASSSAEWRNGEIFSGGSWTGKPAFDIG